MKRAWILLLLVLAGCATTAPVIPPRWQLSVPHANATETGTVYLGNVYSSYTIYLTATTNTSGMATNTQEWLDIYQDIQTNRLPSRRCHIDLSLDGGTTWARRIGYGVQSDTNRVVAELVWSPPEDYTMMTTNAMVRATTLDGTPWPSRSPRRVYDLPEGAYPTSFTFPIVGARITSPEAGSIQWEGEGTLIQWTQLGGGAVWNLYWQTPTSKGIDVMHWITSISNVVTGANSKTVSLNVPPADQLRLAIVSVNDPKIIGYSGIFTVDP